MSEKSLENSEDKINCSNSVNYYALMCSPGYSTDYRFIQPSTLLNANTVPATARKALLRLKMGFQAFLWLNATKRLG